MRGLAWLRSPAGKIASDAVMVALVIVALVFVADGGAWWWPAFWACPVLYVATRLAYSWRDQRKAKSKSPTRKTPAT